MLTASGVVLSTFNSALMFSLLAIIISSHEQVVVDLESAYTPHSLGMDSE